MAQKRTNQEYKTNQYGLDLVIPKGTRISNQTSLGYDPNYNFVDDWSWYRPDVKGYARAMMLHDLVHRGVNVPDEIVEEW